MLIRLIYVSQSVDPQTTAQADAILRTAHERNARLDITGVLCIGQGVFLQVLEGERAKVTALYARIHADPRHRDVELIHCESICERRYGRWSMAHVRLSDVDPETKIDWPEFNPYSRSGLVVMARIDALIAAGSPVDDPPVAALRTPDARFADLPGFPFAPHYVDDLPDCRGLRAHYVDEGPPDADRVFLCLHGQPTWSYLYRRMIPVFAAAGARVVAPDLIGFGRSDKPIDEATYTFTFHREMLRAFIARLDLRGIVLVVQDWGGLLGLTLPMADPARYRGLLAMNTMFASGDRPLGQGFLDWRAYSNRNPDLAVGKLMSRTCPHLTPAEVAAYDAPFPEAAYKAGVRRFPNLVPDRPDAEGAALSREARDWFGSQWQGRTFMAIGMTDPVLGPPVMRELAAQIRGCPPPLEIAEGGHFVQEWGERIAREAVRVL